jgi:hypothetical protein
MKEVSSTAENHPKSVPEHELEIHYEPNPQQAEVEENYMDEEQDDEEVEEQEEVEEEDVDEEEQHEVCVVVDQHGKSKPDFMGQLFSLKQIFIPYNECRNFY